MGLTPEQSLLIEGRIASRSKNMTAAYLWWVFLGGISAHRFYLGRPRTAILQIILNLLLVGLVWTLIDAFLIPGMVRNFNDDVREDVMGRILAARAEPGF